MSKLLFSGLLAGLVLLCSATRGFAATTVSVSTLPDAGKCSVGTPVTLMFTFHGGLSSDIVKLPKVSGLTLNGSGFNPNQGSGQYTFFLTPDHAGNFTIPGFDIKTKDGQTLHVSDIKIHVE